MLVLTQFVTLVIRDYSQQSISGTQLQLLLSLIKGNLHEDDQQPTALSLLQVCDFYEKSLSNCLSIVWTLGNYRTQVG
jgi:hypothetical protein